MPNAMRGEIDSLTISQPPEWMFGPSVEARNALQRSGKVHPLTCGKDRMDVAHRAYQAEHGGDFGQLIAIEGGWRCPACDYRQPFPSAIASLSKPWAGKA